MPLTPSEPHITVAVVLSGSFAQIGDPLDWVAQQFGIPAKVDRVLLAESLADARGGPGRASAPIAEALSRDKHTRFRIQIAGKCEGQMVALCSCSFDPRRLSAKALEDAAIETTVLQSRMVLGVQATRGAAVQTLPPIEQDAGNRLVRLMPLNTFNRAFFREQILRLGKDKKVKVVDVGEAVYVELVKPWLFYDVSAGRRKRTEEQKALPFFKE